ncbi:hypothetical protein ccrud_12765 [Corynebacterium crudilactis]|uniref:Uncharacterized protein n=1 Tax=Corynebacterium crudilactis TaxID=1652495 RepID=A0A172QWA0_9CORY|nr:hypothetical protein ccrud_12765 [Corynebacterium crudilactis]
MEPQEKLTVPKGLKHVLIEGTDGRFDSRFQLYRASFEEIVEETSASLFFAHRYHPWIAQDTQVYTGGPGDWTDKVSGDVGRGHFVVSETSNPAWCFAAPFIKESQAAMATIRPWQGRGVAKKPEAFSVKYDPWAPYIEVEYYDFRASSS